jgi:hypothetical protein
MNAVDKIRHELDRMAREEAETNAALIEGYEKAEKFFEGFPLDIEIKKYPTQLRVVVSAPSNVTFNFSPLHNWWWDTGLDNVSRSFSCIENMFDDYLESVEGNVMLKYIKNKL